MRSGFLLAEFTTPEQLLVAVRHLGGRGYRSLDAYTPWPIKGMDEALQLKPSPVAMNVLVAGLVGAAFAYGLQWYVNAVNYPLVVGARPAHAAPAFVPITFETTVLFAGLCAIVAVLVHSGLPRLWDPVFEIEGFERAFVDRFWLGVEDTDPAFNEADLRQTLGRFGALRVVTVTSGKSA